MLHNYSGDSVVSSDLYFDEQFKRMQSVTIASLTLAEYVNNAGILIEFQLRIFINTNFSKFVFENSYTLCYIIIFVIILFQGWLIL